MLVRFKEASGAAALPKGAKTSNSLVQKLLVGIGIILGTFRNIGVRRGAPPGQASPDQRRLGLAPDESPSRNPGAGVFCLRRVALLTARQQLSGIPRLGVGVRRMVDDPLSICETYHIPWRKVMGPAAVIGYSSHNLGALRFHRKTGGDD